jgi:hypothetical protein
VAITVRRQGKISQDHPVNRIKELLLYECQAMVDQKTTVNTPLDQKVL